MLKRILTIPALLILGGCVATPPVTESSSAQPPPTASKERTQLIAEINKAWAEYKQRPRRKHLRSADPDAKYLRYVNEWQTKIELVGNKYYPEDENGRLLYGEVLLAVAINSDGTLNDVTVAKTSGNEAIDQSAMRIVRLAAPFAVFSLDMRTEIDVLHITRWWRFDGNAKLE